MNVEVYAIADKHTGEVHSVYRDARSASDYYNQTTSSMQDKGVYRCEWKEPVLAQAAADYHSKTPRRVLLEEAAGLIDGDRNMTYGTPTQNFSNIAELWSVQMRHKLKPDATFTATDVAVLQSLLKIARMQAQPKRDNFVDLAGYAACGWECQEAEDAK